MHVDICYKLPKAVVFILNNLYEIQLCCNFFHYLVKYLFACIKCIYIKCNEISKRASSVIYEKVFFIEFGGILRDRAARYREETESRKGQKGNRKLCESREASTDSSKGKEGTEICRTIVSFPKLREAHFVCVGSAE